MMAAVDLAMEKARAASVGLVLVTHTTHTGALGCYTQALARQGFAALAVSASGPLMLYHGAAAAAVGTNPLSIAVPGAGSDPVLLDMTTGATSMGSLMQARRDGTPLEPGLAADAQGRPVTDPQLAKLVLPLGGAKGSGLSLMIELLASHLGGNPVLAEALEQTSLGRQHRQNALLLAIDCSRFVAPALLAQMAQRLADDIHGLPPAQAGGEIRLPGERGDREAARRLSSGIPLPASVVSELSGLAQGLGIAMPDFAA
jgi:ureidoglycolate dehydrogenase (NAD+)